MIAEQMEMDKNTRNKIKLIKKNARENPFIIRELAPYG